MRELFKDEVRLLGAELGLPREFLARHPVPGPGPRRADSRARSRAEKVALLQKADEIVLEEIRAAGLYDAISQAFAVLLPVQIGRRDGRRRAPTSSCSPCARSRRPTS